MATLRQQIATNVLRITRFRDLIKQVETYRPNDDLTIIRKAYEFSLRHHRGQVRASGEPYLVHPLAVASVLAELKLDPVAICAGLLHDAVEDTTDTLGETVEEPVRLHACRTEPRAVGRTGAHVGHHRQPRIERRQRLGDRGEHRAGQHRRGAEHGA